MQRIVRHRKAFYQKQNDLKNGNVNFEYKNKYTDKLFVPPSQSQDISKNNMNNPMYQSSSSSYQNLQTGPSQVRHYQTKYQTQYSHLNTIKNQTQYFCDNYYNEVLNNPINYELPVRFLKNHKIDSNLRARMLDWMVQVMTSYKFNNKTYFAGVNVMDRYFEKMIQQQLQPTDLHLIGIVSMMIASKMQEVYPLKLQTIYQKIGHKKMSENDLTFEQSKITSTLNYKLNSWTFYDLAIAKLHILIQYFNKNKPKTFRNLTNNINQYKSKNYTHQSSGYDQIHERVEEIQNVCSYISKHLYYDYEFFCGYSLSILSDVVLKLTFQIFRIQCQLQTVCTSQQIEMEICKEKLIEKIRHFDNKFKGINNLKKFTNPEIVKLVQRELQ